MTKLAIKPNRSHSGNTRNNTTISEIVHNVDGTSYVRYRTENRLPDLTVLTNKQRDKAFRDYFRNMGRYQYKHRKNYIGYRNPELHFRAVFAAQKYRCGICKTSNPGKRDWHWDHDHNTQKPRGILCAPCNQRLGFFEKHGKISRTTNKNLDLDSWNKNAKQYLLKAKKFNKDNYLLLNVELETWTHGPFVFNRKRGKTGTIRRKTGNWRSYSAAAC